MVEKPIIFSGPMVRAILDGRKTQTRRVLKPQPFLDAMGNFCCPDRKGRVWNWGQHLSGEPCTRNYIAKRYAPGDLLWVRETWANSTNNRGTIYRADSESLIRWKSPIHMPREYSRITLRVTDVRVQRLQNMNRGDAMKEGCPFPNMAAGPNPLDWFRDLWDSLNAKRGHLWESNPWVCAITFERIDNG